MVESPSSQRRRRTLALASVVAAYVLSFFQRFAPAGIASDLAAAFNTSASSLGALAATYFYVYTLMQVPTGILVDTARAAPDSADWRRGGWRWQPAVRAGERTGTGAARAHPDRAGRVGDLYCYAQDHRCVV